MKKISEALSSFENADPKRVDLYINSTIDNLKSTNAKFNTTIFLLIISIVSYHLFVFGDVTEITFFGIKISSKELIQKWFLIVPSVIFLLSASIGYLRVYQMELIGWLIAKYYSEEYKTEIYRSLYPSSFILGLDILRKQETKSSSIISAFPSIFFAFGSIVLPAIYIYTGYAEAFEKYGTDSELIFSSVISFFLILHSYLIIKESQKIA